MKRDDVERDHDLMLFNGFDSYPGIWLLNCENYCDYLLFFLNGAATVDLL